jgi:regulator of extracellular matrix RemA (YlzA/DUF370 family)
MKPGNEQQQKKVEEIAAYVHGEMSPEEVDKFEARLHDDETLMNEVEAWRDTLHLARGWANADAPGVDRVAGLEIPSVTKPKVFGIPRGKLLSLILRKGAVAAAIFAMGFVFGMARQQGPSTPALEPGPGNERISQEKAQREPQTEQTMPEVPAGKTEVASVDPEKAQRTRTTHTTERDGRIIIETRRGDSGTRAIWVVDGNFRLASAAQPLLPQRLGAAGRPVDDCEAKAVSSPGGG